ncbi:TRAP transporter large permease subunit [Acuticoccus sp. MNP-M23]|uniref:TRAP transporter large permease subunit n=1 Tax=Acuticoccus sp. MNP-M23 TaxID=3072793 RepID=UPI002815E0E2|nr:TRAP transporter large permease subunit [Acuticoccus sp. MNP-M23]WMS42051.1 TRAP transporter large permease subunit [Acuticoccus sp. MNP-M23]
MSGRAARHAPAGRLRANVGGAPRCVAAALAECSRWLSASVLLVLVGGLALNVAGRLMGWPLVGANLLSAWLMPALAFAGLPQLMLGLDAGRARGFAATLIGAFALGVLVSGMTGAAFRVGGVEPVLGIPVGARFGVAAAGAALALALLALGGWRGALAASAGIGLVLAPVPALPAAAGLFIFCVGLFVRAPVALALIAAVGVSPGLLTDAALAQNVMRGLSPSVLLAVPLFILSAALMLAGGVGARLAVGARSLAGLRPSAPGEANVWASLLFGGVSASSVADAALAARLLAPPMVAAGYSPARAAAVSASAAILPNVMPPSIALLLAAAATDQSVGTLWFYGAFAALVLAAAMLVAVRLTPPDRADVAGEPVGRREAVGALLPIAGLVALILGALRLGVVTAVEAGVVAVLVALPFALRTGGMAGLRDAFVNAAGEAGRVALLIGAAAPVGFLLAVSGVSFADFVPLAGAAAVLAAALALCLLVGTALDAGAAILLMLPVLVPAAAAAGVDPAHAALAMTIALIIGGLTPPVGILILVVKDVTGADGVYRAAIPYILALVLGLALIAFVPLAI